VLVRNTREIAMHYAKGWLLLDVVSCLPISYVTAIMQATSTSAAQGSPPNTKVFKILRLLRLAKLLRLGRLKKIIKRYEEEFEVCAAPRSLTQTDRFRTASSPVSRSHRLPRYALPAEFDGNHEAGWGSWGDDVCLPHLRMLLVLFRRG
jgi:hypothetical protein